MSEDDFIQEAIQEISLEKARDLALNKALKEIKKNVSGQVALYKDYEYEPLIRVPLPFLQVNHMLGGGLPLGRIIEVYGFESGGKSLFSAIATAEFQKRGYRVAWLDMERCLDLEFYEVLGVDVKKLILGTPETAEDCLDTMNILANSAAVDLIVCDSVAAMRTKEQMGKTAEEKTMASVARVLSDEIPKLIGPCDQNKCSIIFINQVREKVGVMFGPTEDTPGGKALKFYASIRLELKRKGGSEILNAATKDPIGHKVNIKCVKNKTAPPGRKGEFTIYYDGREVTPRDIMLEAFDIAEKNEIFTREANTFTFKKGDIELKGTKQKLIDKFLEDEAMRNLFLSVLTAA